MNEQQKAPTKGDTMRRFLSKRRTWIETTNKAWRHKQLIQQLQRAEEDFAYRCQKIIEEFNHLESQE